MSNIDHKLNILDYSKIDADKLELIYAPFNLGDVLHQIHSMFSFQATAKVILCNFILFSIILFDCGHTWSLYVE